MEFLDNSAPVKDVSEIPRILQQLIDRVLKLEDGEKAARKVGEVMNKHLPIYLPKVH